MRTEACLLLLVLTLCVKFCCSFFNVGEQSKAFGVQVFSSLAIIVKVAVGAEVLDSFPGMRDLNPESDPDR